MPDASSHHPFQLNEPSQAAIDALVAAGWDSTAVPEAHATRATAASQALANLAGTVSVHAVGAKRTLIDAVIARVMLASEVASATVDSADLLLSPEDEDALDALFSADHSVNRVPASLRTRAEQAANIGRLVAGSVGPSASMNLKAVSERESRIDATLAKIAAMPVKHRSGRNFGANSFRRIASFRLRDLASAAAALVLGAVVLWPMIAAGRQHAEKTLCRSRLSSVASAMGAYGFDFDGAMPMTAGFSGQVPWWDVGVPGRSNSANLFTLAKHNYAKLGDLACPGNPTAKCGPCRPVEADWSCLSEVSFSYAIPTEKSVKQWGCHKPTVILADGSPVVRRIRAGEPAFALENSPNHFGQGQNALRSDGSVIWMTTPVVDGDNIWLPGLIEATLELAQRHARSGQRQPLVIRGTEIPTRADEVMLGP